MINVTSDIKLREFCLLFTTEPQKTAGVYRDLRRCHLDFLHEKVRTNFEKT